MSVSAEPRSLTFENLAAFLNSLPYLPDLLYKEITPKLNRSTTDGEFRSIRRGATATVVEAMKAEKKPYLIQHFPDVTVPCKIEGCHHPVTGSYLEIVNPITRSDIKLPMPVAHNILYHNSADASEPLRNLGNSPYGDAPITLNAKGLKKVFDKLDVPEEVIAELDAYLEANPPPVSVRKPFQPQEQDEFEREHDVVPIHNLLTELVNWGVADIHIKAGHPPCGVLRGEVQPLPGAKVLTPEVTLHYCRKLMTPEQLAQFHKVREMDTSFPVPGTARFRCNAYWAAGAPGMVLRVIGEEILPAEVLGIPTVLKKTVFERQGLILITGQTGSGKTTTLAALLEFANHNRKMHVLTLENPVEFVYIPSKAIFTQREMEVDSMSFTMAMRGALRQKPDIILIGEMRDAETITAGLKAAETGHLVMSTLHTNDAVQTIARLINTFPPHEQAAVRIQLANTLKASVAQRLIPRADKAGRVASLEILLVTPNARGENTKQYIATQNTDELYKILRNSEFDGMQSQNQSLFKHYKSGIVSADDALANSDNPDELVRLFREHAGLGGGR